VGWRHGVFACLNLFKANPPTCHNPIFLSRHQRGSEATAAISDQARGCWQVEQRNLPYNYNCPATDLVGWVGVKGFLIVPALRKSTHHSKESTGKQIKSICLSFWWVGYCRMSIG